MKTILRHHQHLRHQSSPCLNLLIEDKLMISMTSMMCHFPMKLKSLLSLWIQKFWDRGDAPHLMPGENNPLSYYYPWGYGYQWWLPRADRSDYAAVGVYNQFIYVSPNSNMTIVKLSANSGYGAAPSGATDYEFETIDLMRAITDAIR